MDNSLLERINSALDKLDSFDADLRFMGLSDIKGVLENPAYEQQVAAYHRVAERSRNAVVKHLSDPNMEVQTQAVKTLGPLVSHLKEEDVVELVKQVAALPPSGVRTLALRTAVANCVPTPAITSHIIDCAMIPFTTGAKLVLEDCDLVNDVLGRLSTAMGPADVSRVLSGLKQVLNTNKSSLVHRRCFAGLALLVPLETNEEWASEVQYIANALTSRASQGDALDFIGASCAQSPARIALVPGLKSLVLELASNVDEDVLDVSEKALEAMQRMYNAGLIESSHVFDLAYQLLRHNPNYVGESLDESDDDGEFEISDDDEFYDGDLSWKLRRQALNLAVSLLHSGDSRASSLVEPIIEMLHTETEDSIREQGFEVLSKFSGHNLPIQTIIDLAKKHVSKASLLLLAILASQEPLSPEQYQQIAIIAGSAPHSTSEVLSVAQALGNVGPEINSFLRPTVVAGLNDSELQIVIQALDAARASSDSELVPHILNNVARFPGNPPLQGQALRVAAAIAPAEYAQLILTCQAEALEQIPEIRAAVAFAMREVLEKHPQLVPELRALAPKLVQLLHASKMSKSVSALLRLLSLIAPHFPDLGPSILAAVLVHPTSEPAVARYSCELLAGTAATPGVVSYTLSVSNEYANLPGEDVHTAIVNLWGALARDGPASDVKALVETSGSLTPFWAQVYAQVLVSGDIKADFDIWDAYTLQVVCQLAQRGRPTLTLDQLQRLDAPCSSLGPALAETALASNQLTELYKTSNPDRADLYLSALDVIMAQSPSHEALVTAGRLASGNIVDMEVCGRILGNGVVLTGSPALLDSWPDASRLPAVKHAFGKIREPGLRNQLLHIALNGTNSPEPETHAAAVQCLAAIVQLGSEWDDQLLEPLLRATVVNEDLVRTVQMGPFKHKVDDGSDTRKAAYEALFTISSRQQNSSAASDLLEAITRGLEDEHDVKLLCLSMVQVLAASPSAQSAVESVHMNLLAALQKIEGAKVRETAVKQEHDRYAELGLAVEKARTALNLFVS